MTHLLSRAWAALERGRHEIAEKEFRLALTEDPDNSNAKSGLALCLLQQERFDVAEQEAREAIGIAPYSDFCYFVLAKVLFLRNKNKEALQTIEEAIQIDPEDASHRGLLANIHADDNHWDECLAAADAGLAIDPEHTLCTDMRAYALTQMGRKDEASQTIADALSKSPDNSMTHANQGWAMLHRNNPAKAKEHYKEALRLDPSNDFAREGLLNAIKAENPLFRGVLAFLMFLGRQTPSMRWGIIIAVIIGYRMLNSSAKSNPEWGLILYPLIAICSAVIYSTWLADPLMNLVMRTHPLGKHALTRDQTLQANLIGACLLLSIGLFAIEFFIGLKHTPSFIILLTSIPLTIIHDAAAGWPRRLATIMAITFCSIAAYIVFALHMVRLSFLRHQLGDFDIFIVLYAMQLHPVFFYGLLIWTLVAILWVSEVKPTR